LEFTIYRFLEVNLKTKLNQLVKKDYYWQRLWRQEKTQLIQRTKYPRFQR